MTRLLPLLLLLLACETLPPDVVVPKSIAKVGIDGQYATGFFVEKNLILSVAHYIHNDETTAKVKYQDEAGQIRITTGSIIYANHEKDFSLVHIPGRGIVAPLCHAHFRDPIRIYGWIDKDPGSIGGYVFSHWSNKYTTTANSSAGYSGGPVTYKDCVIAMHHGRTSIGTTFATMPNWEIE
jgi:hypothetical protein